MQGIKPMGLCEPWDNYKNKTLFPNMKIKQTTLRCYTKKLQVIYPMVLCPPWAKTYPHNCKLEGL